MKISLNWLKDYIPLDASIDDIKKAITFLGFEVEQVIVTGAPKLDQVVVGEVLVRDKHPNADKLSVCQVDIGPGGVKTIVCGAQNYKVGDRVPVALPGAVLPGNFVIKQSKIRGQLSDGMLCSAKELGVADEADGLLLLSQRPPLGKPINEVLPAGDTVFDIEITPNRPDCLSHLGIARELSAWMKKDLRYPAQKFTGLTTDGSTRADLLSDVRVEADEGCPLYTAHIISGIKVAPSPAWLQERLKSIGLRPINNIVDVGNYVMFETGQPLHAFDARKIGGDRIVVRHAADGEKILTLDGKERILNSRMLVIADASKPLVVAGIMGGENAGVSEDTTDIVLEAAYFKPQSIRWTSKKLGMASDSSYRYERGIDPHTLLESAYRAIDLIIETAGGTVVGPAFRVGADRVWQNEISLKPNFVRAKLGFDIPDDFMREALESLELHVVRDESNDSGETIWGVSIPSWRGDLDRPIDLVEEILRLYGTNKIPESRVMAPGLILEDDPIVQFNRQSSAYLVGQHFHECVNYTLRSAAELKTWVSHTSANELALANPFVENQSHLRPTLLMGLLESLQLNQSRDTEAVRLFETGRVFIDVDGVVSEYITAAFLINVPADASGWLKRGAADFYTAKNLTLHVATHAGVDLSRQDARPVDGSHGWQEGHSASVGDSRQGYLARFGLMNLAMVKSLGIEGQIWAGMFAILPEKLSAQTLRRRYQPFSPMPAVHRDLALVVDLSAPAGDVRKSLSKIARSASGNLFAVEKVDVFDVYHGAGLPEGKKSLALSLSFRSADRTLTDDEVNVVFQKIQDEVLKTTPYAIRK